MTFLFIYLFLGSTDEQGPPQDHGLAEQVQDDGHIHQPAAHEGMCRHDVLLVVLVQDTTI